MLSEKIRLPLDASASGLSKGSQSERASMASAASRRIAWTGGMPPEPTNRRATYAVRRTWAEKTWHTTPQGTYIPFHRVKG